nr:hypothetical protein [uncultured Desulfuromonas sp.]
MYRSFLATIGLLFLLTNTAKAVNLADDLQFHGFASQGYIDSHNNNFLAHSRSGSIKMSDIGLNLNWQPIQSLRLGAQGYYRNLGDYNENSVVLDWGVIDYRLCDFLGIRAGKVKMPLGLYNEERDSPFLLPMVFLPQSIYDESRRDSNLAYMGVGVYGNISCGQFGDLDYHLFTGETDFPDESQLEENNKTSAIAAIDRNNTLPADKKNPLIPATYESLERESDDLYGGALIYNMPCGIRLSGTLLHSKASIFLNGSSQAVGNTLIHKRFVLSAEYTTEHWLLASEYSETDRTTTMFGSTSLDGPSQSWYLMACYSPIQNWTFSVLYDEFYRMKHDKHSDDHPQSEPYSGWRKDLGAGVRYDINEWCNLKVEYHYIDGAAMQLTVINDDPKRYWTYFAARLSVVF